MTKWTVDLPDALDLLGVISISADPSGRVKIYRHVKQGTRGLTKPQIKELVDQLNIFSHSLEISMLPETIDLESIFGEGS